MNLNSHHTEDSIPFLNPLPPGYDLVREYECICNYDYYDTGDPERVNGCGGIYYRRISVSPSGIMHDERTACKCVLEYLDKQASEEKRRNQQAARQMMILRIERYFKSWNLLNDEAYKSMKFEKYQPFTRLQTAALTYLKDWTPNKGNICLAGKPGRGKTHLALATVKKAAEMTLPVLAIRSIDLLNRLRRCYSNKDENMELEILQTLKQVDVLLIDDIGTERATGWVLEKLYDIVDYRHTRGGTIFTTNLEGDQMQKKLGGALTSRIYANNEMSRLFIIDGQDWRVKTDPWLEIGTEINKGELDD